MLGLLLYIAAVILVIFGIIALFHGSVLVGILLIVAAGLVGPGGNYRAGRRV